MDVHLCMFDLLIQFDSVPYLLAMQANNCYIFPGVAHGCIISGAIRVDAEMFLKAGMQSILFLFSQ